MKRSTAVLCGVLLICTCVLGINHLQELRAEAAANEARVQKEAAVATQASKIAMQRPFEDYAMARFLPTRYSRPASDWQSNEKAFYEKILSGGKFDVLVVPFQVWGWAVDKSTRSIMTAELAASVSQSQKKVKVPDPYLVAKALGDGQRQLKQEDIYKLADAIGVKRIIWGYAGHDRKGKMAIAILTQDYAGTARNGAIWTGPVATKKFENILFDDDVPAIEAYESLLPEILKSVGVDVTSPIFEKIESKLEMAALPPSPLSLVASAGNPAQDVYGFLLYSALTPANIERTKGMFAEKAHVALLSLSPGSPEYRALRARTYMALGLRMAAIRVLDEPQTSEEKELLAALNGNLLDVRAIAASEKNPLKRLLQKLDENRIAAGYGYGVVTSKKSIGEAAALKLPGSIWQFVVTRAFVDWNVWSQHDNASLKMLLDYEFPVKGYSLEEIARGSSSLSDPGRIQAAVNLSVFNHARKFIDANAAKWCCEFTFNRPGPLDYLELLQGVGNDNLVRHINFLSQVQGAPNKAISFANSIDATYKGYPYYSLERSKAEARLAANGGGAEKDALNKAAHENAFNAAYWEQGQSLISTTAIEQFNADGGQYFGQYDNLYYTDIPYRPYYWTWAGGGNLQVGLDNNIAAFKNATWEIDTVSQLVDQYRQFFPDEARATNLLTSITGRFIGSPHRNTLFALEALTHGDDKAAQAFYRDNIKLSPEYWNSYMRLGKLLFESGEVNAAAKVFHSYGGFKKNSGESPVAIANYAYEAGSYFYWSGHFDLASPFYKIAALQGSGASSEITSDLRLKLLAGDINGAMAGTVKRARRYNESYAYRDYLGQLHASGHSEEAWAGFKVLLKESQAPHIWESALVGHHVSAQSETEVVNWAQQSEIKGAVVAKNAAAVHIVRFATTDRIPSSGLSQVIDGLDQQRWKVAGYPTLIYGGHSILQSTAEKRRVKSIHAYFVEGYRALKLKDFAAAKSIFDEAATLYDFSDQATYSAYSSYLPYYALAAARVGQTSGVEKIMSGIKIPDQRFDYYLAKAILAGASGKNDEALQSLQRARYRRPHTDNRPLLTQYTFGEICELVSELTGSNKIRELALDWAKKSEKFEPWQSWAYALEAKLTKNPVERKRAMAMTLYLDSKSERLSAFGKPEMDDAVKMFGGSNPLLKGAPETPKKGAI